MLAPLQLADAQVDLSMTRRSSHGEFVYNLHLVGVHQERYVEIREDRLRRTLEMLRGVAAKKGHLLSRVGLLPDHIHWTVGCGVDESPVEVALGYLNNIAYAHQLVPMFQFGFYAGTFGTYDMNAVRS
jgi:REP element-mobilizing transposase RayT